MKTKPNYVKINVQNDQDESQEVKIYDVNRIYTIREFLFDESEYTKLNSHAVLDRYRPPLLDIEDFDFTTSEIVKDRFVNWYRSNAFAKILIDFEDTYIKNVHNIRRAHENQAFYMDYLSRLKIIYFNAVRRGKIQIDNTLDFKYFYLFLNQIEAFVIYGVKQTAPMFKSDLLEKIEKWFKENLSDTVELDTFQDLEKLIIVKFAEYSYSSTRNTSLISTSERTNLYTFELLLFDQDTFKIMYSQFKDLDDLQEFEDQIEDFCGDCLDMYIHSFPF